MNLNNVSLIKLGNDSEIALIKWNGIILYQNKEEIEPEIPEGMTLYTPYEYRENSEITEVNTIVNKTHTSLAYMFQSCENLRTINGISDWNTSNVIDMKSMFSGCTNLTSLDVSSFDTGKVTDMSSMFQASVSLVSLDLSNFVTSQVTKMEQMFLGCISLETLDMRKWDTSSNSNPLYGMFANCEKLHTLRLDKCSYETIKTLINTDYFPTGTINGETRKIYCTQAGIGDLYPPDDWDFVDCITGEIIMPTIPIYEPYEYRLNSEITEVKTLVNESHTDLSYMFASCEALKTVYTRYWNTSSATNMACMFGNCKALETLDTKNWNTSSVENMGEMFYCCDNLYSIEGLEDWDTSSVTSMSMMFLECKALGKNTNRIDLRKWNVSKVLSMRSMFLSCSSISALDLSNWNTSGLRGTLAMFSGCTRLSEVNLSGWDLSSIIEISDMFENCDRLSVLRLDGCSSDTIEKIITSSNFPTGTVEDESDGSLIPRKIYVNRGSVADLTEPTNWSFEYID